MDKAFEGFSYIGENNYLNVGSFAGNIKPYSHGVKSGAGATMMATSWKKSNINGR